MKKSSKIILLLSLTPIVSLPFLALSCVDKNKKTIENKAKYEQRLNQVLGLLWEFNTENNSKIEEELNKVVTSINSFSEVEKTFTSDLEKSYADLLNKLNEKYDEFLNKVNELKKTNSNDKQPGAEDNTTDEKNKQEEKEGDENNKETSDSEKENNETDNDKTEGDSNSSNSSGKENETEKTDGDNSSSGNDESTENENNNAGDASSENSGNNDENDDSSSTDTPNKETEEEKANSNVVKWGHWNILNFTGDTEHQSKKTKRIALLANKEKFDVLGLTEVNNEEGIKTLVDEMNALNSSNLYSYVLSKKLKGEKFGDGAAEHVAVIYNNQTMETEAFNNNEIGYSYDNKFDDKLGDTKAQYSRPPYGVKFKFKLKPEEKLTFVFAHFDGPGVSGSNKKIGEKSYKGIGSFEYRESQELANVLDYFDQIDGDQSNIFFGGDTNIKKGKQSLAFSTLEGKYNSVFKDIDDHKTSLGKKHKWSEPYDKLFYKTNYELVSSNVFDIYKTIEDEEIKSLFRTHKVEIEGNWNSIATARVLSDHTFVSAEFLIK
ncbi:MnuA family membrane nuclease [Metamycoplasma gateae]|uniref:Variable surface lipoprotein n=1 Tax=Metamycoplasma gateae TaxID=35769 RepID=A0ABZ2AGL3_9BACT|nr:variable surface lipoprotein [Metamycoplasma gateae]